MRSNIFVIISILIPLLSSKGQSVDTIIQVRDTIYIQQPPIVIKKQIIVHDTVGFLKEPKEKSWFVNIRGGLDYSVSDPTAIKGMQVHQGFGDSYSLSLGKEIGAVHGSVGLGVQRFVLEEEHIENHKKYIYSIRRDTIDKEKDCWWKEMPDGTLVRECIVRETKIKDSIYIDSTVLRLNQSVSYFTLPIKLAYRFKLKQWYIAPEICFMPMFYHTQNYSAGEGAKVGFDRKLSSYKMHVNISREVINSLYVELGCGYQGLLNKHQLLNYRFINVSLGLKYFIF